MTPPRSSQRRFVLLGIGVVLGIALLSFALEIYFTEVQVYQSWEVRIESEPGFPPAEVYFGDHRLGMTPVSVFCDGNDPRFKTIDSEGKRSAEGMARALGLDLEIVNYPRGSEDSSQYTSWDSIARWPDGTLDRMILMFLRDGVSSKNRGFFLRIRRGDETYVQADIRADLQQGSSTSPLGRMFLRRVVRTSRLLVQVGRAVPPTSPTRSRYGPGEWLLDRVPGGTEELSTPRVSQTTEKESSR